MGQFSYIAVLVACLLGSGWLEFALRTRVFKRWRRLLLVIAIVVPIFMVWDAYAIAQGHWTFNPQLITDIRVIANIPLDEILFFITIPIAAILGFEAVRAARPSWWRS